jgi:hypothetical protein
MNKSSTSEQNVVGNFIRSGALAGALSVFAFTIIHDLFISDIWFALVIMLIAGALCGLCIGWSYALLTKAPSTGSWWRYNMLYVGLLFLLGIVSVLIFEPPTTIAALSAANEPPEQLIRQAYPFTALFTLFAAVFISLIFRANWRQFSVVLLTCTILIFLLGLNVSVLGLVYIPHGSLYLVTEFFGLILFINVVYATFFMALERKRLLGSGQNIQQSESVDKQAGRPTL